MEQSWSCPASLVQSAHDAANRQQFAPYNLSNGFRTSSGHREVFIFSTLTVRVAKIRHHDVAFQQALPTDAP
jgi:hypothetical protein